MYLFAHSSVYNSFLVNGNNSIVSFGVKSSLQVGTSEHLFLNISDVLVTLPHLPGNKAQYMHDGCRGKLKHAVCRTSNTLWSICWNSLHVDLAAGPRAN